MRRHFLQEPLLHQRVLAKKTPKEFNGAENLHHQAREGGGEFGDRVPSQKLTLGVVELDAGLGKTTSKEQKTSRELFTRGACQRDVVHIGRDFHIWMAGGGCDKEGVKPHTEKEPS